jgi:hypothetical protein
MRLLAGLARRAALRQYADRRRVAVAPSDAPNHGPAAAAWVRASASTEAGTAPLRIEPVAVNCMASTTPVRWPARRSSPVCCWPASMRTGDTAVTEPAATRDYTERMLAALGADVAVDGLTQSRLRPGRELPRSRSPSPATFSSAAFFLVAGAIAPAGELIDRKRRFEPAPHRFAGHPARHGRRHRDPRPPRDRRRAGG